MNNYTYRIIKTQKTTVIKVPSAQQFILESLIATNSYNCHRKFLEQFLRHIKFYLYILIYISLSKIFNGNENFQSL